MTSGVCLYLFVPCPFSPQLCMYEGMSANNFGTPNWNCGVSTCSRVLFFVGNGGFWGVF